MRILFTLSLITLLSVSAAQAQEYSPLYRSYTIPVENEHGQLLANPFAGGLVKPQFSNMDINLNGKMDLLIYDRSDQQLLTFINTGEPGKPSFRYVGYYSEYFPEVIHFVQTRDYNRNGKMDIFTYADQQKQHRGFRIYRNVSENGELKFELATPELRTRQDNDIRVNRDDLSGIADISGDGTMDILTFTSQGVRLFYYKNFSYEEYGHYDSLLFEQVDWCWGRFAESGAGSQIQLADWYEWCTPEGRKKHAGGAILPIDINQSGAMDLLIGDAENTELKLIINGKTLFGDEPYPVDTMIEVHSNFPSQHPVDIDFMPAPYYVDVDNSGVNDLIVAPNGLRAVQLKNHLWYYRNKGENDKPDFEFIQDDFLMSTMIDEGAYSIPVLTDINSNGRTDLLVVSLREHSYNFSSANIMEYNGSQITLFENTGNEIEGNKFRKVDDDFLNISSLNESGFHPTFGDLTGNGKPDMIAGRADGKINFYINQADPGKMPDMLLEAEEWLGIDAGEYSAPFLFDYNGNGLLDLIIGNRRGTIHYYENTGDANNPDFQLVTDSLGKILTNTSYGSDDNLFFNDGFSRPVVADLNNDGTLEIITGSLHRGVLVFRTEEDPTAEFSEVDHFFYDHVKEAPVNRTHTINTAPAVAQLNFDEAPDMLIGTARGGLIYFSSVNDGKYPPPFNSVNEFTKENPEKYRMYPNPARDKITLERIGSGLFNGGEVTIYDLHGRKVLTEHISDPVKTIELNVSDLPGNIYIIRATNNDGHILHNDKLILH